MKLANPLHFPIAILAGGITLVIGVRLAQFPSTIMLPIAAGIAYSGAVYLKSRQPESFNLDNPELERELQAVRASAVALASKANDLKSEAAKLLTDSFQIELLAAVLSSCNRAEELPKNIDNLARYLQGSDSLQSVSELRDRLAEVQRKISVSSGLAKQHLSQLEASIKRNIKLAQEGQDTRVAQIVSLSTQIQDFAGVLQKMQNKLRTTDLSDPNQLEELQVVADELSSLRDNVYLLVSR
ncbi:MAG: hypothetical protein HC907_12435 [Richelia sp. SM1_7_0]|nr:hypothetical protein [Richelia sp. SM1_7_0]